jgi:SulP family sulfate permease
MSEKDGVTVLLAGVRPDLFDAFGRLKFADWILPDRIFKQGTNDDSATLAAIRSVYDRLGRESGWEQWHASHNAQGRLYYQV